jgi:hypothetical protein
VVDRKAARVFNVLNAGLNLFAANVAMDTFDQLVSIRL